MGETRVDLLHLLEDLRDAYPGAVEETLISEAVANALDSGAGVITLATDPASRTITIRDDGRGMQRRDLARYHDLGASSKTRGKTIGFAGVGIKLGLLIADQVLTETLRGKVHVATTWALLNRRRAPWKWVPPPGLVADGGTAVQLILQNPLSPLLDPGFIETALWTHYQTLFDSRFAELLREPYPEGIRFVLNGAELRVRPRGPAEWAPIALRLGRKRHPAAVGWVARTTAPLAESEQGIAVSTLGKVIKRGWDWLGLRPAQAEHLFGLVEAPALAEALTLNKADFIRTGPRGALFLAYRKGLQEAVGAELARWGDAPDITASRPVSRPVERDLRRILAELSSSFPLLAALVEHHPGGQRKLPLGGPAREPEPVLPAPLSVPPEAETESSSEPGAAPDQPQRPPPAGGPGSGREPRAIRPGLTIGFEEGNDGGDLARLVETTVLINVGHPAYRRASASRSEGYHLALAVALALAPLVTESRSERAFVQQFLGQWGKAANGGRSSRR